MLDWLLQTKTREWPWTGLNLSIVYIILVWSLPCLNAVHCGSIEINSQQLSEITPPLTIRCVGDKCSVTREDGKSQHYNTCWNGPVCWVWSAGKIYTLKIWEDPIALFTALLVLSTIALWRSTDKLWLAGKEQLAATKTSADASLIALRPWVSCKVEIAGPLAYSPNGDAMFDFKITVKNVGHSPAMGVRLTPFMTLLSPKHESAIVTLKKMADNIRALPVSATTIVIPGGFSLGNDEPGLLLFPNDDHVFYYKIPIKRGDIDGACEDLTDKFFMPQVFGIVTYTYPLATVRAVTAFLLQVEKRNGPFRPARPVAQANLSIGDLPTWRGFAS